MNQDQLEIYQISKRESVVKAMQKIDENGKGILFVVDEEGKIAGSLTDGDIRRWLIRTGNLEAEISEVMHKTPVVIFQTEYEKKNVVISKYKVKALPVLSEEGTIVDVFFTDSDAICRDLSSGAGLKDVDIVIMAGGEGTRLYPYTKVLPKPLIPIGEVPIMERIINAFTHYGAERFFVSVNYHKAMIKSYFSEIVKNYELMYIEEDKPLGTAGSLKLLEQKIDQPIIITNCDILIHANYGDIYDYHVKSGNALTIVSALKNITVPYGVIHSSENGKVDSMEEKPQLSYFINTGMYVMSPEVLEKIPGDTFFHMTDLADMLIESGERIGMYPISEDSFFDMGEFSEMSRMEEKINQKDLVF